MKNVTVNTDNNSYNVKIGSGLLPHIGELMLERVSVCNVTVITDDIVDKLYADTVVKSIRDSGYKINKFVIRNGEQSKNIQTYQNILEFMAECEMTRKDVIVALGGGVVGDLAGYAAATYLRGIRFISIATTLLAAVDSSVGGKTGINLNSGKNQVGAFWQPELVICDTDTLSTLSDEILSDGYAEIIKYGMICDFDLLKSLSPDTFMDNADTIIERCVAIKSRVVGEDEFDTGVRQLLNMGHTIGHGIEKLSDYKITHGHGVAIGMAIITRAAVVHGICPIECLKLLLDKLRLFGLPTKSVFTANQLAAAATSDKKRSGNEITIIVPTALGECSLHKMKVDDFADFITINPTAVIKPFQLHGDIMAMMSKSDLHRKLICNFLSENPKLFDLGDTLPNDITATLNCLNSIKIGENILDCGESGTTLRFMLPIASALGLTYTVHASGRLPERPINQMIDLLTEHGCTVSKRDYPLAVSGQLQSGTYKIAGNISSQYISGLLLALPILSRDSRIELSTPLESSAYVEMTIKTMKLYGVDVDTTEYGYHVKGGQKYISVDDIKIEGDWSNSAFWLCSGALSNDGITCHGLDMESLQPDKEILNILIKMGVDVTINGDIVTVRTNKLNAIDIDMSQCPDIVPVTAVIAAVADGTSILRNIGRLRLKESDRLQAITDNLTILGADITINGDSLVIKGVKSLKGGIVNGYNDHRIVMAMAVASVLCSGDIIINDADAVNKSYPNFFNDFNNLGGESYVI